MSLLDSAHWSDTRLTWVQQTALKGRLERCEQLLPLIGSFQTELQVFDGSFGFWEI